MLNNPDQYRTGSYVIIVRNSEETAIYNFGVYGVTAPGLVHSSESIGIRCNKGSITWRYYDNDVGKSYTIDLPW